MALEDYITLSEKDREEWKASLERADAVELHPCFGGNTTREGFRFDGLYAYKVKKVKSVDAFGNKTTTEKLIPVGSCCVIVARLDAISDADCGGMRLRCITPVGDIKEFDIRVGELDKIITLSRRHGFHVSNGYQFVKMLENQWVEGILNGIIPEVHA